MLIDDVTPIEPSCFVLEIKEYGKTVIKYSSVNKDWFIKMTKTLVGEQLSKIHRPNTSNNSTQIKNTIINIYEY